MASNDWLSGYGDGSGAGYEDGSGYGDGYGAGYGNGYGYGDGYGAGDGYGYGYGDGSGDGDGYGDTEYWTSAIAYYVSRWPQSQQQAYRAAVESGAQIAYWKSDKDGTPCNGGHSESVSPGLMQEISGPLEICTSRALHATELPHRWKGERTWIVALYGQVQKSDGKFGALKRQILGEC